MFSAMARKAARVSRAPDFDKGVAVEEKERSLVMKRPQPV